MNLKPERKARRMTLRDISAQLGMKFTRYMAVEQGLVEPTETEARKIRLLFGQVKRKDVGK